MAFSQANAAQKNAAGDSPWETFGVNLGVFVSATDTSFRIGSGIGLNIDAEEALNLDATNTVFRADALWRFSDNQRHRLDFTWFSLNRDATRQIGQDITIEDKDGNPITIDAGSTVETHFDFDIYELAYSYSFFQDDRVDLAVGIGLFLMPLDFGLRSAGVVDEDGSASFTAPLPVFGLRMDVALTPKWFLRSGTQIFYLEYDSFTGSVFEFKAAIEYNPWAHVGLGLGFDTLRVALEADGEDYPSIDFRGNVEFAYSGLQLYLRYFF
ncbi:hypothetical protein [Desulfosarcina sp.]|uniref:hypothetical protein n=1 Tax=Desulfosarcina sp. TaxID=2027861 RepID=UPI003970619D